ncbi:retention module-containing protein [Campylobacter sp.]|uniref:retention module-containing protein n=1 Tax=Campylobacter sp. TaxID=205 RepID=UPI0026FBAD5C|nr:retention module-containing protein [Campylobacter sp.]
MATIAGIVKQISGIVLAVDANGNERVLKVGDEVFLGETIKTQGETSKVVLALNNGKEVTVLGDDALAMNQSMLDSGSQSNVLADINSLQQDILRGQNLEKLEETAAGGSGTIDSEGTFSQTSFTRSGSISNVLETYGNLENVPYNTREFTTALGGNFPNNGVAQIEIPLPPAPTVEFIDDANNDGILNKSENDSDQNPDQTQVKITIPPETKVNDVINIIVTKPDGSTENKQVVVTPQIKTDGHIIENVPVQDGKTSKVDATITDHQTNKTSNPGSDQVTVDLTPTPAPTVVFNEDTNDNGILNKNENNTDGKQNETKVTITVPPATEVGDTLNITITKPDGSKENKQVVVTPDIKNNGYVIDNVPVQDGKTSKVEATITDKAGNESPKGSDEVKVDLTPTPAPTVVFNEDTNDNGILNKNENNTDGKQNETKVTITVPPATEVGDTLNITITKPDGSKENKQVVVTPDIKNNGYVIDNVPVQDGKTSKVEATITDKAGNESPKGSDEVSVDITPPAGKPTIEFIEDGNNDKFLNKTENNQDPNQTSVKVKIPAETQVGDTINITIKTPEGDIQTFTHKIADEADLNKIKTDGYTVDNVKIEDGKKYTAEVVITDPNGNDGEKSDPDEITVDLTPPAKPVIEFSEDKNDNGVLNKSENDSDQNPNQTSVKVTVPIDTKVGDTINITVKAPDVADQTFTHKITSEAELEAIKKDGYTVNNVEIVDGKTYTAEAVMSDKAGNKGEPSNTDQILVDITPPAGKPTIEFIEDGNNDKFLNKTENNQDPNQTSVKVKIPAETQVGDTINITIKTPEGDIQTFTHKIADEADLNKIKTDGYTVDNVKIEDGKKYTAEVVITDPNGNDGEKSDPDEITVDLTPPAKPVIEFSEDKNDDGILNNKENAQDGKTAETSVTVKPQPGTHFNVGDTINITIKTPGGQDQTFTHKITSESELATINTNGYTVPNVVIENSKTYTAEVTITDKAGNVSEKSDPDQLKTDLTPPPPPKVVFVEDVADPSTGKDDGKLSYTENNSDGKQNETTVNIKVPQDSEVDTTKHNVAKVGDFVDIVVYKNKTPIKTLSIKIEDDAMLQNLKDNGHNLVIDKLGNGASYTVSATIRNSVGSVSDEASDVTVVSIAPVVILIDDKNNDGTLSVDENKTDGNLRSTKAQVSIPAGAVPGDKMLVSYTDVNNPKGHKLTKEVTLTDADIKNGRIVTDVPVLPGVKTEVSAVLADSSNTPKSEQSNTDSVTPELRELDVKFDEVKTLDVITRLEALSDDNIDKTTATVSIPNNVRTGDKLILTVKEPGKSERDIEYTITVDETTGLVTISGGGVGETLVPDPNDPYSFKLPNLAMKPREADNIDPSKPSENDTKISAKVDYANASTPDVSTKTKTIGLEPLKTPEVIFDEAKGANVTGRTNAVSDSDLFNTPVTIKIPKNAVEGDKLKVTITEPQLDGTNKVTVKQYTIHKDKTNGKVTITDDSDGKPVDMATNNSFQIKGVDTLPGKKTIVTADITDPFGTSTATSENSLAELNEMAVYFDEDVNKNTIMSRTEATDDTKLNLTTVSVKIPSNVVTGDTVTVTIKDDPSFRKVYNIERDGSGNVTVTDSNGQPVEMVNNIIKVGEVPMSTTKETVVEAVTQDSKGIGKADAKNNSKLEKLYDDMSIKFDEDTSKNGILSPNENLSEPNKTTISVRIPSNAVNGDEFKLTVTDKDGSSVDNQTYTIHKENGKITLKNGTKEIDVTDNIAKIEIPIVQENRVNVTAEVTNVGDNTNKVSASGSLDVVGTGPGDRKIAIIFNEDDDTRNAELTRREAMQDGELYTTTARVTIPSNAVTGDTLKVTINHGDGTNEVRTYTITNDNGNITVKDQAGKPVNVDGDGNINVDGIKMADDQTATLKAEVAGKGTAEGSLKLLPITQELTVSFDEDNASRNGILSRDESMAEDNALHSTIARVTIPKDVVAGDKVVVTITEPGSSTPRMQVFTIGEVEVVDNTIAIPGIKVLEGQKTSVEAKIQNSKGAEIVGPKSSDITLETIKKGLEVVFDEDASNDGIMSRDEAMQDVSFRTTTVSVNLPSNVITGDKLKLTISEPNKPEVVKELTINKDESGKITLTGDVSGLDFKVEGNSIKLQNIPMLENAKTSVKAELTNSLGEDKTESEDSAKLLEMQDIKAMEYTEGSVNKDGIIEIDRAQNKGDGDISSTKIFMRLPDDAVVGDKMVISYTDPDDKTKSIKQEFEISEQDMSFGKIGATILTKPGTDVTVTSKTISQDGVENAAVSFKLKITDDKANDTIEYDTNKKGIYGGEGYDTLVFNENIDLSKVESLDKKIDSFEAIKLGKDGAAGAVKLTITAQDVLDVTDKPGTILKILGDNNDQLKGKGEWREAADQTKTEAGFKLYESVNQVDGQTIKILIDTDIKTDF